VTERSLVGVAEHVGVEDDRRGVRREDVTQGVADQQRGLARALAAADRQPVLAGDLGERPRDIGRRDRDLQQGIRI
jgi:hypothetical protein